MRTSHALILRLLHDPQFEFEKVRIEYVNRGAIGDRTEIQGSEIIEVGKFGLEVTSEKASILIPFHRIRRITYEGKVLWEKTN
ncbi:MAG: DUF504 domain-containing protein [Methanotrichaceae archaeon]|nr:DUF504 domain-containing protein [Methanotrichaceae archaeon]